jgi:hypothetical protein
MARNLRQAQFVDASRVDTQVLPGSNQGLASRVDASDCQAQSQIHGKRVKITVAVQQFIPAFDATRSNHGVDGLANCDAEPAQDTWLH